MQKFILKLILKCWQRIQNMTLDSVTHLHYRRRWVSEKDSVIFCHQRVRAIAPLYPKSTNFSDFLLPIRQKVFIGLLMCLRHVIDFVEDSKETQTSQARRGPCSQRQYPKEGITQVQKQLHVRVFEEITLI